MLITLKLVVIDKLGWYQPGAVFMVPTGPMVRSKEMMPYIYDQVNQTSGVINTEVHFIKIAATGTRA